jgi:hypothetical protein
LHNKDTKVHFVSNLLDGPTFWKKYVPAKKPASWVVWIFTSLSFKSWT